MRYWEMLYDMYHNKIYYYIDTNGEIMARPFDKRNAIDIALLKTENHFDTMDDAIENIQKFKLYDY